MEVATYQVNVQLASCRYFFGYGQIVPLSIPPSINNLITSTFGQFCMFFAILANLVKWTGCVRKRDAGIEIFNFLYFKRKKLREHFRIIIKIKRILKRLVINGNTKLK